MFDGKKNATLSDKENLVDNYIKQIEGLSVAKKRERLAQLAKFAKTNKDFAKTFELIKQGLK